MPTATRSRSTTSVGKRARVVLLWIAAVRILLGIIAIPLAPVLYEKHYLWLVLLRPTKEVLLVGGFFAKRGDTNLIQLIAASVPLAILGVWMFYVLGLAYARDIHSGKLPFLGARVLPQDKIKKLEKVLKKKGAKLVFIGRLAILPSAAIAAAAGSSKMDTRTFLIADGAGGLLSLVEVIGAGYLFGEAYKSAGPWLTGFGIAALLAAMFVAGRVISRD